MNTMALKSSGFSGQRRNAQDAPIEKETSLRVREYLFLKCSAMSKTHVAGGVFHTCYNCGAVAARCEHRRGPSNVHGFLI